MTVQSTARAMDDDTGKVIPFRDPDPLHAAIPRLIEVLEKNADNEHLDEEWIEKVLTSLHDREKFSIGKQHTRRDYVDGDGEPVSDTQLIAALYDALDAEDMQFAQGFAESLLHHGHDELAVPALRQLLETEEDGNAAYEDWENAYEDPALDDEGRYILLGERPPRDRWVEARETAARVLGYWRTVEAIPDLLSRALHDEDGSVRSQAALSLAQVLAVDETCREELCRTWHSHPRKQRVYTAIAVAPYSPEAVDFLLEVAGDADSYAKGAVAERAILGLWRLIRDED